VQEVVELVAALPSGQAFDTVLVFGSGHGQELIAAKMLELHRQRPRHFIVSGYRGEARHISALASTVGVPATAMTLETAAANTAENLSFSEALLHENDRLSGIGLLAKDYAMLRTYLTASKVLTGARLGVLPYELPLSPAARFRQELLKLYAYFDRGFISDPASIGLSRSVVSHLARKAS
jgi:uncharacterized SAM-binding protein YcdF (DUF218 family)